jgi:hypothetical protein
MPKNSTNPLLFDETNNITISNLRKWNYLKMNSHKSGTINWSRNGNETGSISIKISITEYNSYIILNYKYNDTKYNYKIHLVTLKSNLGTGNVWYFLCPFTKKRCRIVHLIGELFMHRSALPSAMYSKQTESKRSRGWDKFFGSSFHAEKLYKQVYSKHFKTHYNGKPTKRYLKLLQEIHLAESTSVTQWDLEQYLLGKR